MTNKTDINPQNDPKGSIWRRWDLHIHTKDTAKNDQFTSKDFNSFCDILFEKALENQISAIGITDYFSIDNYKKVKEFVSNISSNKKFSEDQKKRIRQIFLLPNVELRMLPVTDKGRLVNIHCIFNPDFEDELENDFFGAISYSGGTGKSFVMNRKGIIGLGKDLDKSLDEVSAYKKGVANFVVSHGDLQKLLDTNSKLKENVIVIVSNSNTDGASAFQKHYDMFEGESIGSLDGVRKSIYSISQVIFSGNEEDRKYFLGKKVDDEDSVKNKCGSLKPCIHGSDAHTEEELFIPDESRFCWIKADLTFDGLKQIIYEPDQRVFIGREPELLERVRSNKTKYIKSLKIDQKAGYDGKQGIWFKEVNIDFNKELIAIIGNKGSGKSALSDIVGLLGHTHNAGEKQENLTFLSDKIKKFRKKGYAENFEAELIWEDESDDSSKVPLNQDIDTNQKEKVKYLPQNYFESLTNDLEGTSFDKTLKSVTFLHIPSEERLGHATFEDLEKEKIKNIEADLVDLKEQTHNISGEIIKLEAKKHPNYREKLNNLLSEKEKELHEHLKNKPGEVKDPNKDNNLEKDQKKEESYSKLKSFNEAYDKATKNIEENKAKLNVLSQEKEDLTQMLGELKRFDAQHSSYKSKNRERFDKYQLDIDKIAKFEFDESPIKLKIEQKNNDIKKLNDSLRLKESIDLDSSFTKEEKEKAYKVSFFVQQEFIQEKIDEIKNELSKPEKEFQEYKEKLDKWERHRKEIEGDEETPGTLNFYKVEQKFLTEKLSVELNKLKAKRTSKTLEIFKKKKEIVDLYNLFKKSIDEQIARDEEFAEKFKMQIDAGFTLDPNFTTTFLGYINKSKSGTFRGAEDKHVKEIFLEKNLLSEKDIEDTLNKIILYLEEDQRSEIKPSEKNRETSDQVDKVQEFYDLIFNLDYLKPIYELKLDGKILDELSPGEKGALLLVFYLMIDKEDIPLIIDQPEDNLDNKSVFQVLTYFIKNAKKRRQIIIVTHNPNLAVGSDAEQIIYVELDKKEAYKFIYELGSIENPKINKRIVEVLEGTMPAFDKRKLKYLKNTN